MTRAKIWVPTFTGRFYPFDPNPDDVRLVDVAHGLAHLCRYTGACREFYSVAQHSVLVSEALEREGYDAGAQLAGLLHDAAETYINDISARTKAALEIDVIEAPILWAVRDRFRLSLMDMAAVVPFDRAIQADEIRVLFPGRDDLIDPDIEPLGIDIKPVEPLVAKALFLHRYKAVANKHLAAALPQSAP